jgi:hypothetical protein
MLVCELLRNVNILFSVLKYSKQFVDLFVRQGLPLIGSLFRNLPWLIYVEPCSLHRWNQFLSIPALQRDHNLSHGGNTEIFIIRTKSSLEPKAFFTFLRKTNDSVAHAPMSELRISIVKC